MAMRFAPDHWRRVLGFTLMAEGPLGLTKGNIEDAYNTKRRRLDKAREEALSAVRSWSQAGQRRVPEGWSTVLHVWRYSDAPGWLREISPHFGGDEDWLVCGRDKEAVEDAADKLRVCDYTLAEVEDERIGHAFVAVCCHA